MASGVRGSVSSAKSLHHQRVIAARLEVHHRRSGSPVKDVGHQDGVTFRGKPPRHLALGRANAANVGQMDNARPPLYAFLPK
jgi:hypothetical protein